MHPLHQRWLLHYMNISRNYQPIEGIGKPWLMRVKLNVQYQFKEFLKTQIWVKLCNFLSFFLLWLSLSTY